MSLVRKLLRPVKNYLLDQRAAYYLRKVSKRKHDKDKPLKVGFIVFEPETWDKLQPVYEELMSRNKIDVRIIVVPSYDQELKLTTHYGKELEYFRNVNNDCILAYATGKWIDIENDGYDYIFYQDPYNQHMPPILRSDNVIRFSKICYVPYGFVGSDDLSEIVTNKDFYRNVTYGFLDAQNNLEILRNRYRSNIKKGLQHFDIIGYPAYEKFFGCKKSFGKIKKILWAPRWTYDEKIGKSHFFEYKDSFIRLKEKHPDIHLAIRPHPMMFSNFVRKGLMTVEEIDDYKEVLESEGIELSLNNSMEHDMKTTDILISDFSSIIPMFYFMNKPVIYTDANMNLNKEYSDIMENSYIAKDWSQVEAFIDKLIEGIDSRSIQRELDIKKQYKLHHNASKKIVDTLVGDYKRSVNGGNDYA